MARKQPISNLAYVSLALSKDPTRPVLTSMLVTSNAIIATDTHRLHFVEHPHSAFGEDETFSVLIGGELTGIPGENGLPLYPNWKRVVPSRRAAAINPDYVGEPCLCVALTIAEAIVLCEAAKSVASKSRRAVLVITEDNRLLVRTGHGFEGAPFSRDIGIPAEQITVQNATRGEGDFEIAVNYSYLADALNHGVSTKLQSTSEPAIWITFGEPTRPILVEHAPDAAGRRKAVIMPMARE